MENFADELIYDKDVVEFITIANQVCHFLELITDVTKFKFIDQSLKLGALLYLKTSTLPNFEKFYEENTEKFVSEYDWQMIANQIELKLGEDNKFMDIATPNNVIYEEQEQISYAEAFADIYQDLKNVTTNYQIASHEIMNDSLWECKDNFENYWGPRLLALLNDFHLLKYDNTTNNEIE